MNPILCLARGARFGCIEASDMLAEIRTYCMARFIYGPAGLAFALDDVIDKGGPDVALRSMLTACVRLARAARMSGVGRIEEHALYSLLARIAFGALRHRWYLRCRPFMGEKNLPSWDDRAPTF